MLIALYVGNHAQDELMVRMGCSLERAVQKGPYGRVTHVEAILAVQADGSVTIASSSLRDGGVRTKRNVRLDSANWLIADVPQWDEVRSAVWFADHDGEPYDWRGALATVLPGHASTGYFCNEAVGASVGMATPQCFTPAQFSAICFSFGRGVTSKFFNDPPAFLNARMGSTQQ
jgi:hypothetical protein